MSTQPPVNPLIRNVAIIAHVDHGKTTLVDNLLKQSGNFRSGELEKLEGGQHGLIMDSNPLERERGITILSKNCAVQYTALDGITYRINIIDTPGHADFGGEVERVLRMADGVCLLVDSFDGPMPQTKFVLTKALEAGLKPVVIVNKIDRPDGRPMDVMHEVFDLFVELGAEELALDFPTVYCAGRDGWATNVWPIPDGQPKPKDLRDIFEAIIKHVPPPRAEIEKPLQVLVTNLDYNDYVGRIGIGRIFSGKIKAGQQVAVLKRDGKRVNTKVAKLMQFEGLKRSEVNTIEAGDLCALIGLESVDIGDTVADPENAIALPPVTIDEPTMTMLFRINDSPFAGQEGSYVTSRQIRERLFKELERNVAMRVEQGRTADEFMVSGRGVLSLGILIENMRREGFELSVGKPEVIVREIDGVPHEPVEELVIDSPNSAVGSIMELVGGRKGELKKMEPRGNDLTHLKFEIPSRSLIGMRGRVLTATQGEGIMTHSFLKFAPISGEMSHRAMGVLISLETGAITTYALQQLADRGIMFAVPQEKVYAGQVIGEHNRDNDLVINVTRMKHLTNMRVSGKEATVVLKAPRKITLEYALEYIEDDELVEVTPGSIRIRKKVLDESMRKRSERQSRDKAEAASA
ncbi:MAG: translational GTPase TypA [Phycisphaerae bacterium]|nr:translational GTPase TypA [Phycisphaerae bacterium]MBN8598177.1 translational GTPase TypA [Planctomycetota bacterium]